MGDHAEDALEAQGYPEDGHWPPHAAIRDPRPKPVGSKSVGRLIVDEWLERCCGTDRLSAPTMSHETMSVLVDLIDEGLDGRRVLSFKSWRRVEYAGGCFEGRLTGLHGDRHHARLWNERFRQWSGEEPVERVLEEYEPSQEQRAQWWRQFGSVRS